MQCNKSNSSTSDFAYLGKQDSFSSQCILFDPVTIFFGVAARELDKYKATQQGTCWLLSQLPPCRPQLLLLSRFLRNCQQSEKYFLGSSNSWTFSFFWESSFSFLLQRLQPQLAMRTDCLKDVREKPNYQYYLADFFLDFLSVGGFGTLCTFT